MYISHLITEGWETVLHWIPRYSRIPDDYAVDTTAKDATNLASPEQPTTYQYTVAEIARNSALPTLDVHKNKRKTKSGRQYYKINFHLL
jgi:hypothetical protein